MRSILLAILLLPVLAQANLVINSYPVNPGCGASDGSINISVSGGLPPYTFAWADGPTTEDRAGLAPGFYSLTVTDATLVTDVENVTLTETLEASSMSIVTYAGGFECPGTQNGSFRLLVEFLAGQPPYSVSVTVNGSPWSSSGTDGNGNPIYSGLATMDAISYTITDANGCTGGDFFPMYGPLGIPAALINNLPACGADLGSILIQPDGSDWLVDLDVRNDQNQSVGSTYQTIDPLQLTDLPPGDYTVFQYYTWSLLNGGCYLLNSFTIGDLGPDCGTVNGSSWYDLDADCVYDTNEVPIPYSTLTIQPGDQHVITGLDGTFSYLLANGNYTLAQDDLTLVQVCPAAQPVPFTMNTNVQTIDLANGSTEPLDIVLYAADGVARPGMNYGISATISNPTPQASGSVTVTLTFDPVLSLVSASPTPTLVAGNVITWDVAAFGSYGMADVQANFLVPIGTALGTPLASTVMVSNSLPESTLANNSTVVSAIVVNSYDPNDKTARTSSGTSNELYFIDQDEWIDYTIRFQNTGTAEAIDVVITDTLAAELDMSSFEQGAASHAFDVSFKPGRVVQWRFANINLPDSNANEAASHGLVGFRIKPHEPLSAGSVIENIANIYFDYNPPVITEPSVLVAELSTGVVEQHQGRMRPYPNPATDRIFAPCSECGTAPYSVTIQAVDGKVVLQATLTSETEGIDISTLASGAYLLRAIGTRGNSTASFIKGSRP